MLFCPKCGKEISGDSKFCPKCGQQIATTDADEASQTQQNMAQSQNTVYVRPAFMGYTPEYT